MSELLSGHVLLVEDDAINQIVIRGLLGLIGCTVSTAGNGKEALAMLSNEDAPYDAVLMDIGMPDIDGMEVTRRIRASQFKLKDIPIIALTGHINPKDKQQCLDSGMNSFIPKPTTKEILYQELAKFIHK